MYYIQLNSVRAIAVLMVIIFHWIPGAHDFVLPLGSWGVELFFVLSGFLITKILLDSRYAAEIKQETKGKILTNFLLRRSLRIFPIYYLSVIAVFFLDRANVSGVRDNILYYIGYATNFLYFDTQTFPYPVAHFWSLAVEEQFYLVWPWFILFLPEKWLFRFLIGSIVFGIASRVVLSLFFSYNQVTPDVLPFSCFDSFSIGGLFSYMVVTKKEDLTKLMHRINIAGLVAFFVMIILLWTHINTISFLHRTIDSIFFLALIANTFIGVKGIAGAIFDNPVLLFLGKISYGLYIYHLLTPWVTKILINVTGKYQLKLLSGFSNAYNSGSLYFKLTIDLIILLIVASASWVMVEKPINRYKHIFR